jgi:hypothetical protein
VRARFLKDGERLIYFLQKKSRDVREDAQMKYSHVDLMYSVLSLMRTSREVSSKIDEWH